MFKFLENRLVYWGALVFFGVVLFFAYAWLPLSVEGVWNSPDETAVAYFSDKLPVFWGDYDVLASYSEELGGAVHPRSVGVVDGELVPRSWIGLSWVLNVVGLLPGVSIEFAELLVSVIAVLAVFAWGGISAKFFDDKMIGIASGFLLAVHPGWWYFTARGLHPNVLFTSLLIFVVWFWYVGAPYRLKCGDWARYLLLLFGGMSFGMALFVRTNEAIWVVPVLLFVLYASRKYPKGEIFAGVIGVILPLLVMLFVNASVYGSWLSFGYFVKTDALVGAGGEVLAGGGGLVPWYIRLFDLVFPFGFHEWNIIVSFVNYHLLFFLLWSGFALFGGILFIVKLREFDVLRRRRILSVGSVILLVSLYLVFMYGSWVINDNPDPNVVSIGTSYIRYWLPISVVMTGLAGYFLVEGVPSKRGSIYIWLTRSFIVVLVVVFSFNLVYFEGGDSVVSVARNLDRNIEIRDELLDLVDVDDIVIVDRADKILFPYRNVIMELRNESTYGLIPVAVDVLGERGDELFYFGISLPEEDLRFLRETRLDGFGIDIESVRSIGERTLYRFVKYDY